VEKHVDEITDDKYGDIACSTMINSFRGDSYFWNVLETDSVKVFAAPILHSIPSMGFLIIESNTPGSIKIEEAKPLLMKFKNELKHLKTPLMLLNNLKAGEEVILPDGTRMHPRDYLEPEKIGRRVMICGDTYDATNMISLLDTVDSKYLELQKSSSGVGQGVSRLDVLVHECTNACLTEDLKNCKTEEERASVRKKVTLNSMEHGHSTADTAGMFARAIDARHLVLNHFSSRYKGDALPESLAIMEEIRQCAASEFLARDEHAVNTIETRSVTVARDFTQIQIPRLTS
jgi:ribonuclease Z